VLASVSVFFLSQSAILSHDFLSESAKTQKLFYVFALLAYFLAVLLEMSDFVDDEAYEASSESDHEIDVERDDNNWIEYYSDKTSRKIISDKLFLETKKKNLSKKIRLLKRELNDVEIRMEAVNQRNEELKEDKRRMEEERKVKRQRLRKEKETKKEIAFLERWLEKNKFPMSRQEENFARNLIENGNSFDDVIVKYKLYVNELRARVQ